MINNFLKKIKKLNINIQIVNNKLDVSAEKGVITKEILDEIRLYKEELINFLSNNKKDTGRIIPSVNSKKNFPLSFSQYRLWILSQFEGGSEVYNLPKIVYLRGGYDMFSFKRAVYSVIDRHEVLRTIFKEDSKGEIRQWILDSDAIDFKIEEIDFRFDSDIELSVSQYIENDSRKAFDLASGPLLRASLLRTSEDDYVFYYNMHHIISDGWSMNVLSKDVFAYYESYKTGEELKLSPLRIQYKDYASWQSSLLSTPDYQNHRNYWVRQLQGELPVLDLPREKKRPIIKTYNGKKLGAYFSKELTKKMESFSQEQKGTLFMVLLTTLKSLLYRYTGQNDLLIGTPVAGRDHSDLEDQIGFYVNTVVLRNEVHSEDSFLELFNRIRINTLDAYTHQAYPFSQLVDDLDLVRDASRNALFDVMITLQNTKKKHTKKVDLNCVIDLGKTLSKFDLTLTFEKQGDYLSLVLEYNSDIYCNDIMVMFISHYKRILSKMLMSPEIKISNIDYLSSEERRNLLEIFNKGTLEIKDTNLVDLFEYQVNKTPEAIAVVYEGEKLSYNELNQRSNQLGHYLFEKGIQPDDLVGICLKRGLEMIISILGVLKSGGAYVPIDPEYPQERIDYILKDTGINIVLSSLSSFKFINKQNGISIISLDKDWNHISSYSTKKTNIILSSSNLAYIIYTSGSTGKPKGVMIEHGAIVNRLLWGQSHYQLNNNDAVLQKTSFSFDISIWELLWPIICGARLIFAKPEGHKDVLYLKHIIESENITTIHFVPSMFRVFLEGIKLGDCNCLERILCSGESLQVDQVNLFKNKFNNVRLDNLYGPTEAAIEVSSWEVPLNKSLSRTLIGKSISNTNLYVLDDQKKILPLKAVGELYIGGVQVARGYLNQETLTQEKFQVNPFRKGEKNVQNR